MLKDAKGFGLIQVLVAVGIMTIIGAGMTTMIVKMAASQKGAQNKNEYLTKLQEINDIVGHKDLCQKALRRAGGAKLVASASGTFDYPLESIVYETGAGLVPVIKAGQTQDGIQFKTLNLKGQKISSSDIRLKDPTGKYIIAEKWLMTLRIEATKAQGSMASGPDAFRAKETTMIGLFEKGSNAIVGCYEKTNEDYICENLFDGNYDDSQSPRCRLNSIGLSNHLGNNPGGYPSVDFMIGGEDDTDKDGNYDEETVVVKKVDAGPPFGIVRRFGIGTKDPHTRLHVANGVARFEGGVEAYTYLDVGTFIYGGNLWLRKGTSPKGLPTTGDLIADGESKFHGKASFGQDVTAKSFLASSDQRLKHHILSIPEPRSQRVFELQPRSFRFRNDESQKVHYGLVAQDVRKIFPELVSEGDDGFLAVDYQSISLLLLQENQKMRKELDEIKNTLRRGSRR